MQRPDPKKVTSDSVAAATSALESSTPPMTSLSRSGSLGLPTPASNGLWGQSSNIPLLSPSELAGASEKETGSNTNDTLQALLLAQVRQRLQQQEGQQGSISQPKKRPRLSDSSTPESLAKGLDPLGASSSTLTAGELGLAASGLAPSLLRSTSSMGSLGSVSNLLSPSIAELAGIRLNRSTSGNAASHLQHVLRQQQMQELQLRQIQELKKQEEMKQLSQLQSRDAAVLQLMLQQQQQQQAMPSIETTNSSLIKALQEQKTSASAASKTSASGMDEAAVAKYMRSNSQKNVGNSVLQALAVADRGVPPPPPMVSAVSSMDSVAIMSMLLPGNQQKQTPQQQSATPNRLLGAELALGPASAGLGAGLNLNNTLISPMSYTSPSLGNLGMGGGYFGGLNNSLSSLMGRGGNAICPPVGGNDLGLHPSAAAVLYEQRRLAAAAEVSNTVRDSQVGKPADAFADRDADGRAHDLPTLLVVPMDHMQLSSHQTLLRYQIEVFRAGEEDTSTHTRGRNKPVTLGQIGIRCRHCKVLPVSRRKRGSVYFPRAVEGFYQAAQNMNSTHLQTGECPLMGNALRQEFANLIATRGVSTGAGRAYWAKQARKLGLRNTENGIVFDKKEPGSSEAKTEDDDKKDDSGSKEDSKPSENTKSNEN